MSQKKKQVRSAFRNAVFQRDRYRCVGCGYQSTPEKALDTHYITDRNEMPNGGYAAENGVSLCKAECYEKAKSHHKGEPVPPGFSPAELYAKIGSSYQKAVRASKKLSA